MKNQLFVFLTQLIPLKSCVVPVKSIFFPAFRDWIWWHRPVTVEWVFPMPGFETQKKAKQKHKRKRKSEDTNFPIYNFEQIHLESSKSITNVLKHSFIKLEWKNLSIFFWMKIQILHNYFEYLQLVKGSRNSTKISKVLKSM